MKRDPSDTFTAAARWTQGVISMAGPYSQDVKDRAREHVNEGHPHAEGAEWDRLFEEACRDLAAIDEHNDRAEGYPVSEAGTKLRKYAAQAAGEREGAGARKVGGIAPVLGPIRPTAPKAVR